MKELEDMQNYELFTVITAGIQILRENERKQGYKDGQKEKPQAIYEMKVEEYNKGLNDAWDAAKKIALMGTETSENITGYFGLFRIMENLTPMQVIEKIKAYEDKQKQDAEIKEYEDKQKQKCSTCRHNEGEHNPFDTCNYCNNGSEYEPKEEIKVGYEVYNLDRENKRIVTAIDGNKAIQLCSNGKYTVDNIDTLHWTGREDLRIKKVLEQITLDKMVEVDG